jgi:hypothetical protein
VSCLWLGFLFSFLLSIISVGARHMSLHILIIVYYMSESRANASAYQVLLHVSYQTLVPNVPWLLFFKPPGP